MNKLIDKKLWLAPLAGFTDQAFRKICKDNGAEVLVTEMVSTDGLIYEFDRSFQYARYEEYEKPVGIQIFGSDEQVMAKAVELLLMHLKNSNKVLPDFIDINMGCPVKKVIKRGAGSALLNNLPLVALIVKEVAAVLKGTGIYLTAKIRSGWSNRSIVGVEVAKILAENGVDIIIVHPRTRSQLYSGESDWSVIKQIKKEVNIPVVGNGDIGTVEDAEEMYNYTGCDSIMIGRGALGQPWIFNQIRSYLLTDKKKILTYQERYQIVKTHFDLAVKLKGKDIAVREMKSHLCYYTKGMIGANLARNLINISRDADRMLKLIGDLYEQQS